MVECRVVTEKNIAMRREIDKLKGQVRRGDHEEFEEEKEEGNNFPSMPKD